MFQYFGISIITSIHLCITSGCFWTNIVKLSSVRNCVFHKGKYIYSWSSIGKDCPPIELVYFLQIFIQFLKLTFHLQLLHKIEYIHHTGKHIPIACLMPKCSYVPPLTPALPQFLLCICDSASFMLYSLVCFAFQIPRISDITQIL